MQNYRVANLLKHFLFSGSERSLKYKKNSILIMIFQAFNILASFLLVTVVLDVLGIEEYGVWVTLTTIVSWFGFLDIGLAHGLRNRYAEAKANNDLDQINGLISTTFFSLLFVCCIGLIPLLTVSLFIDWAALLNASAVLAQQLKIIGIVMIVSFCVRIVFNIVTVLKAGDQEPFVNNFVITSGNLLGLVSIYIAAKFFNASFLLLGVLLTLSQILPYILSFIFYFLTSYRNYWPKFKFYQRKYLKSVFSIGYKFFLIQLLNLLLLQSNILIIAHTCGQSKVTEFNIAYKYLWPLMIAFTSIIIPLWSASTEAFAKKDFLWLKNTNKNLQKILAFLIVLGVFLVSVSSLVYQIWLKGKIHVDYGLLILVLFYFVSLMWYSIYRMFMNGVGKIKMQFSVTLIQAVFHVPLTIFFSSMFNLYGALIIMILWNVINCIWEPIQYKRIIEGRATGIWNQ